MPTFESDGLTLHYQVHGEGPEIVLLHGWGADGDEWASFDWLDTLGGRRRALIPDLRGHGRSAKPQQIDRYLPERMATDVAALLDAEGVMEADLFGYSMGAAVALWACVQFPNRFRSLVFGGVGSDPELTASLGRELLVEPRSPRAEAYLRYAQATPGANLEALAACLQTGLPAPPCVELAVFGGEALAVAGAQDRRRAATETLAGCFPGGRFLEIPEADHMGAFAHPSFKEAAIAFLDEVSPA
jgi:pimeloyl-ACP methyl ester carboxylesterase